MRVLPSRRDSRMAHASWNPAASGSCRRYTSAARGAIRLRGNLAGRTFMKEIPIELPKLQNAHDVLATLWARTRIDDLMSQNYAGIQNDDPQPDLRETIIQLGLEYRLMTQFTSFVAVEERIVTDGGRPRRIDVPVEIPEGVSRAGGVGVNEPAPNTTSVSGEAQAFDFCPMGKNRRPGLRR